MGAVNGSRGRARGAAWTGLLMSLLIAMVGVVSCRGTTPLKRGLTRDSQTTLESLLACRDDAEFSALLTKIARTPDTQSVLVLTHAMFDLPADPKKLLREQRPYKMRKLRVERALDQMVAGGAHDRLSARYFRALVGQGGAVEEAKKRLLDWTMENKNRMVWDPRLERFELRD